MNTETVEQLGLSHIYKMRKPEEESRGIPMTAVGQTLTLPETLDVMTLVYKGTARDIKGDIVKLYEARDSDPFLLTGYNYRGKVKLEICDNCVSSIRFQLISTKQPTSVPKVTFVINDLSYNGQKTNFYRTSFFQFIDTTSNKRNVYNSLIKLPSTVNRPPYLVSNRMKLRVLVEPPSIDRIVVSNDGILIWTLDNYSRNKQMEEDGLIDWHDSSYFYTSPQGYRVLVRLCLRDNIVWGGLWFVTGDFDSSLTKRFPHRLTMTLFHREDRSKDLVLSEENNVADVTGVHLTPTGVSSLHSGGYVTNDSLTIKAVVEPLSKKSKLPRST